VRGSVIFCCAAQHIRRYVGAKLLNVCSGHTGGHINDTRQRESTFCVRPIPVHIWIARKVKCQNGQQLLSKDNKSVYPTTQTNLTMIIGFRVEQIGVLL
jgi:hypothetical protein